MRTVRELFEDQLKGSPASDKLVSDITFYFNGDLVQTGDIPLFAWLDGTVKGEDITKQEIKMIMLNERHFDLFDVVESVQRTILPRLKLKNS